MLAPAHRRTDRSADPGPQRRSVNAAIDLLMPVAAAIAEQTRGPGPLGTDATGLPILDPAARKGIRTGTIRCWTNERWVSFVYSPSADADGVREFLGEDLGRTVPCDGTATTSFLERAGGKRPGCWSHGRRRFVVAAKGGDQLTARRPRDHRLPVGGSRSKQPSPATMPMLVSRGGSCTVCPSSNEIRTFVGRHRADTTPKTPARPGARLPAPPMATSHPLPRGRQHRAHEQSTRERVSDASSSVARTGCSFSLDAGGQRTAAILSIIATCIAHEVEPRAYLHRVTSMLVNGLPQARLRDLLPDRMLSAHPELFAGAPSPTPDSVDSS